jgi:hypothetical protein
MDESVPKNWGQDKLSNFIETAQQNTFATFANLKDVFRLFEGIDESFRRIIDNIDNARDWFPAFFLLRAHSSYLGAVRLSTSGQLPEAYMILRGCLENSLYGFYLFKKPKSVEVWLNRHDDEVAKKKVRIEFKIGPMFKLLSSNDSKLGTVASKLYESTIDYGAHPNAWALLTNLSKKKDDDSIKFELNYLTGKSPALALCLKTNAQVGVCSLMVFKLVFKERFDLLGISDILQKLGRGL